MESKKPETEIFDNGRRGEPRLGCDCVQCFGYCIVDHDVARRELPDLNAGPVEKAEEVEDGITG